MVRAAAPWKSCDSSPGHGQQSCSLIQQHVRAPCCRSCEAAPGHGQEKGRQVLVSMSVLAAGEFVQVGMEECLSRRILAAR